MLDRQLESTGLPKPAVMSFQTPLTLNQKPAEIIGITATKEEDFPQWYQEVVVKAGMVEYYTEIAGLFVLRPLTIGEKNLEVPVAIRPTSEAIMYPYYSKWIRSHRDLPLRLNQWNSVVRWETKQTTPFLRTREFLWQEGHTAHLTEEQAGIEVLEILELYAQLYEDLLAVPVVRGRKTENERFAGGYYTMTLEGYIPSNGRGIQGATSHCLGQNFSKMFDISVEDPAGSGRLYAWQNSWAFSTRVIGVMVMIHGDNKGLVLPPRVAQTQIVMVPVGINRKTSAEDKDRLLDQLYEMRKMLKKLGLRVEVDTREGYTPAWKFNDWEMKGVPLRMEFGPKDAKSHVVSYAVRHNNEKGTIPVAEIGPQATRLLEQIQKDMYDKANLAYSQHRKVIGNWDEVTPALDSKNVVLIPFCLDGKCEERIKQLTTKEDDLGDQGTASMGMKSLCIPFEQPGEIEERRKCLNPECDNCESCRRRKVKCSGSQPCLTCTRHGFECRFGTIARRGYSEAYVQDLVKTIKGLEEKLEEVSRKQSSTPFIGPPMNRDAVEGDSEPAREAEMPLSPVLTVVSGPAFECSVRTMVRDHVDNQNAHSSPATSIITSSGIGPPKQSQWNTASTLVQGSPTPELISQGQSRQLFETFLSLMGVNQHFVDPRAFSDSLDLLYQDEATRLRQVQTLWYTYESPSSPPGTSFFAEAIKNIPPTYELGSHGVLAVETLCLAGLYLQWCDRKHDAYVYVGSALRLAIALGCQLPHDEQQGLGSEVNHRVRVWWTAYMLDRIQDTLHNLYEIGRSIPSSLATDFCDMTTATTRTSASLYLMLFQDKVQLSSDSPPTRVSPVINRLCLTCQDAATKSIRILSTLRAEKRIALFGCFDLDATFSAAFILTMMGFVQGQDGVPPEGLKQAAGILRHLSRAGNHAAQRRLDELKQFYEQVWSPTSDTDRQSWLEEGDSNLGGLPFTERAILDASSERVFAVQDESMTTLAWVPWQMGPDQQENPLDFNMPQSFEMDLSHEATDIYSSFNDPTLPLTGVDDVDWAEIGKIFNLGGDR
ncbi:hypothetical protein BKA60DRAFT_593471 [Fusarium oxysporum]|nr:hypothetical protein BKA60DRAFT_593471 [Fusarium oxysporum]